MAIVTPLYNVTLVKSRTGVSRVILYVQQPVGPFNGPLISSIIVEPVSPAPKVLGQTPPPGPPPDMVSLRVGSAEFTQLHGMPSNFSIALEYEGTNITDLYF